MERVMEDDGASNDVDPPRAPLRRGWTTGACAAAAARAAYEALVTGRCPDPVEVKLPGGARASFAVATFELTATSAMAGIVKDAGDDPDVTHGALVKATVREGAPGSGVTFRAGEGVGTVTRPGLPVPPGEPAINPVPREMIRQAVHEVCEQFGASGDVIVEVAIPGGAALALKTLNPRLGIVGGLSILGTTGVVVPYSCAAWIYGIRQGIDVARASGLKHVAGATGSTSEAAVQTLYSLPEPALIDMGDFAGGMLKYLKRRPVPRVTVAGGFAKMAKLGQGLLDLHSRAGAVDREWLANLLEAAGAAPDLVSLARAANTAQQVLAEAEARGVPAGDLIAAAAWQTAASVLEGTGIALDVVVFDREGRLKGRTEAEVAHAGLPRNRR
jgi:cobalt-precorrin-5B (C1)-methyltransferase